MLSYPATIPLSSRTLNDLADRIRQHGSYTEVRAGGVFKYLLTSTAAGCTPASGPSRHPRPTTAADRRARRSSS